MDEFLLECKSKMEGSESMNCTKCMVVGSYYGQFGSIMSTISFAFYMQNRRLHNADDSIDYYIPVVNIQRDVIETKTDVLYYMEKKFGIHSDDLLCLDDVFVDSFEMIIMIDYYPPHLHLDFDPLLVKIAFTNLHDELGFEPSDEFELVFKETDSIATVVSDYIVRNDPQNLTDDDKLSLKILYDCILYHVKGEWDQELLEEDIQMLSDLEGFLGIPDETYAEVLIGELTEAHNDISNLNAMQLIYKYSIGMLTGRGDKKVFVSSVPIGIKDLLKMTAFQTGVSELAECMDCNVMIVIGQIIDEENNSHDHMAVISFADSCLYAKILNKLVYDSDLNLSFRGGIEGLNGKWYRILKNDFSEDEVKDLVGSVIGI